MFLNEEPNSIRETSSLSRMILNESLESEMLDTKLNLLGTNYFFDKSVYDCTCDG